MYDDGAYATSARFTALKNLCAPASTLAGIEPPCTPNTQKIKAAITAKTKAIVAVDFGGWPCDYDAINAIVNDAGIRAIFKPAGEQQEKLGRILVMSDAAHAIGTVYNGRPLGRCADITVFSLHAVKNVTSAEGGVIVLNMPDPFNNEAVYKTLGCGA